MSEDDRVREKWTWHEFMLAPRGSFRMPDGTINRKNRYGPVPAASKETTPAEAEADLKAKRDDALRRAFE